MIKQKEQRLEDLFRQNDNKGMAIAITGSWGIGKTYFWKQFLDKQISEDRLNRNQKIFNRKYAYVSLFGIESLSDLKTQIYSNIENYHSTIEVPRWLKNLPSIFKDTRITQLGINAPVKLIDNLMFNQIKDAIICFDDFERMSNKLDIKDVMGLVNQLKLERNCQVVLILDESKTEDKNKNKYAEYKEKLIDNEIKITSVEPLIRERAKAENIDEPLIDLMVKFAEKLEIHNFRFFQKVIKLYKQFRAQLSEEVAYSTKEIILIRVLVGYFIDEFGQSEKIDWINIKNDEEKLANEKNSAYRKLREISYLCIRVDPLFLEFEKIFKQIGSYDSKILTDIAKREWLSEESLDKNKKLEALTTKYYEEIFTQVDLSNLMELIMNNVGLFSGCQLKDIIEFLSDENKKILIPVINSHITKIFLNNEVEKSELKQKYGTEFEDHINTLEKKNSVDVIDKKADVLNKVIGSGFSTDTSDAQILKSFSKDDWSEFLGKSRAAIFSRKYIFENFRRVLTSARNLYEHKYICEESLKQIEDHFVNILNDLESKEDGKQLPEIKLRYSHWKKKLKLYSI